MGHTILRQRFEKNISGMSELWCDYEARTEWPGLNFAEENRDLPLASNGPDSTSNNKRRRSPSQRDQRQTANTRSIVEAVEQCECDIQYYEGCIFKLKKVL